MASISEQPETELLQVSNLREYFRESVDDAMATNQVTADHHTSHYVVNLLTLFANADAFHDVVDDGEGRRPLALMLNDAVGAPTRSERCGSLQRLGDAALFMAGFFPDDLGRSVVDMDYYISMGGNAYSSLSAETRGTVRGQAFGFVFAELGEKFQQFVDVLNDVCDQAAANSDTDVLRQYEIWLKTGSNRACRLLQQQGIETVNFMTTERQH